MLQGRLQGGHLGAFLFLPIPSKWPISPRNEVKNEQNLSAQNGAAGRLQGGRKGYTPCEFAYVWSYIQGVYDKVLPSTVIGFLADSQCVKSEKNSEK